MKTAFRMKLLLYIALVWFTVPSVSQVQQQYYMNPVGDSLFIADPFVLFHEGSYYLYGTSAGDGFRAWKSDDLVTWAPLGYLFRPEKDSWATGSFWAPF
jgi:beta-xylosidase